MFVISENDAVTICRAFADGGELSAMVEFRRIFPAVRDNTEAHRCVRIIVGWTTPVPETSESERTPKE